MRLSTLLKRPSACLPVAMSLATLTLLLVTFARGRLIPHSDEGTEAHLFQLLMGGRIPIVAFFAIKWLPQTPKEALLVLALQAGLGLAALAPVFILGL